jgi:hypothetical protein
MNGKPLKPRSGFPHSCAARSIDMKKLLWLSFVFAVMTTVFGFAQDGTADTDKKIAQYSKAIKNKADAVDAVSSQAALIPAVTLNSGALDDIKRLVTAFCTSPNAGTYNAVKDVYVLYQKTWGNIKKSAVYNYCQLIYKCFVRPELSTGRKSSK